MHILMVEDDRRLSTVMRRRLIEERHTVDVIRDGITGLALALATSSSYDVIILDVQLPGLDGLEICRQIRAAGVTTPVLICSAHAATEDYVSSLEAGADDYLAKPFAPEEWLARVHALGRRGRHIGPAVAPGMSGVAEADDAPGVTMSDGTLEEAPTRRAQRLAGYLRHAWAASMHRLSPGR